MNTTKTPATTDDARRAAIRRTVWVLVACALVAYGLFLYGAMAPK